MPFEQKYDAATREAATARVLQRQATNPTDRHVFRVVSDEFSVGEQSLRAWVAAARPEPEAAPSKKRRPRFSPVVRTTKVAGEDGVAIAGAPVPEAVVPSAVPALATLRAADAEAALEAEVAALRRGNEALKAAMRVLLDG